MVTRNHVVQRFRAMRTSYAQGEDREHGVQVRVVSHADVGGIAKWRANSSISELDADHVGRGSRRTSDYERDDVH